MNKSFRKQMIVIIPLIMIVLLIVSMLFQTRSVMTSAKLEAQQMISQMEELLEANEVDFLDLTEALKEDCINRAMAVSYIVENGLTAEDDIEEMRRIAKFMQIDEINLFNTDGVMYAGTHPEYFGFGVNDGEQIGFFKPMLENRELVLCQDVMPNTFADKPIMYAMVWREDGKGMVQIGMEPSRLLARREQNELSHLMAKMPSHHGHILLAVDKETEFIVGSSDRTYAKKPLKDIGVTTLSGLKGEIDFVSTIDDERFYCVFHEYGAYYIGALRSMDVVYGSIFPAILCVLLCIALTVGTMLIWFFFYRSGEEKVDRKNRAIIQAAAFGFTGYFVFDWETDETESYYVGDESSRPIIELIGGCPTYTEAIQTFGRYLTEDNKAWAMERLDKDVVRRELEQNGQYEFTVSRYIENGETNTQLMFTKLNAEDYGKKAFMVSTRNVDSIIEKELLYQAELEAALEKANIANKSKTKFLFNMSHDIRTPMNAILGFSAMAEKYIGDKDRVLDCIHKLNSAGEHLQRLINDVLDMARIESGKVALDLQAYHIPTLIDDARGLFGLEMEKKGIEFTVVCDVENEIAFFDRLHMDQIELNLLSNALKYTPSGGKVIYTVRQLGKAEFDSAEYEISVKDTGIGMSEEFRKNAFEAFEREKSSTVDGIQGTGLGLAITKSLVEQMGGTITCKSELGAGTEFVFSLWLRIGEEKDLVSDIQFVEAEANFAGRRILLVEDNELNREIAHDILVEYDFEVDTAEDGIIAVDKVSRSEPGYYDLVLMDIQMPNMDGYKATQAIRRLNEPRLANIPIIAMTANAFEEDRRDALAAGMNEHIAKPIDITKLLATMQKILNEVGRME